MQVIEHIVLLSVLPEPKVANVPMALLEEPCHSSFDRRQELVLESGLRTMAFDYAQHKLTRPRFHTVELRVVGLRYWEREAKHSQVDDKKEFLAE